MREKEVLSMLSRYRGRGFYDPLSEMNRLFEQMFGGTTQRPENSQQGASVAEWAPAIDVLENDGDLVIRAEIPGAKPNDVDVTVQSGVLTISGRRQEESEEERGGYLVRERRYGSFRRSLQLPEDVDESKINARFENGVLEVRIQGAAAAREPKRVQIESQENGQQRASNREEQNAGTEGSSDSERSGS
jgi:HSP20 family protein